MPPSSWAKRTGFRPKFSGETNATDSGEISLPPRPRDPGPQPDLEAGRARPTATAPATVTATATVTANGRTEAEKAQPPPAPAVVAEKDKTVKKRREVDGVHKSSGHGANGNGAAVPGSDQPSQPRRPARSDEAIDVLPQSVVDDDGVTARHSHMKYELRDTPGLGGFFSL